MKKIKTICIIDDDKIFTYATKRLLTISNFCENILEFNNGEEALKGLQKILNSKVNIPDVILLDLNMPIMDGWQFLDRFINIEKSHDINIYIISSSIDPADIEKSKTYNEIKDYIIKPLDKEVLQRLIN